MKKGVLIDFEGGDGTGKSTQVEMLAEKLKKEGKDIVLTKEPGGSSKGKKIRKELLYGNPSPQRELGLFLEDREPHFKELIIPALKEGKWVLCDRNAPASVAYQGYGRGIDVETIKNLNRKAMHGQDFDMVILLDMEPEKAIKRAKGETRFDKETLEFHNRVRKGYLNQWMEDKRSGKRPKWIYINADQKPEEVANDIWKEVQKRFLK